MKKLRMEELGRPTREEYEVLSKLPVVVVLDNVRSMNNVGSFFRTCDAFAIEKIALCGITGRPPHAEIHKTALGAEETVPWEHFEDTREAVERLIAEGYTPVAIEQVEGATMLYDFILDKTQKYAVIFGNEVDGVNQNIVDICRQAIEIPQAGTKHSLNVAVTGGIVLWHMYSNPWVGRL
ncbi:RNA methyltransferase [Alistipes sp. OttesenSCG-928-B03]|nr:RNA methyltransferase [Alistipes sp. OttesenSCG-928-B03]